FSPGGKKMATGGEDAVVRLWDVETGKRQAAYGPTAGAVRLGQVRAVAFSPDGRSLAAAGGNLIVWDLATGKPTVFGTQTSFVRGVAWSADGREVVTAHGDGVLRRWSPAQPGNPVGTSTFNDGGKKVEALAVTHDGKRLLSMGGRNPQVYLQVWNL